MRWSSTLDERLWAKIEKAPDSEGCWQWTASTSSAGYARFFVNGKTRQASRVVYEHFVGPIPQGLELDHLCRNTACVNPEHLEPVTHAENVRRGDLALGIRSAVTHCKNGHEFTPENTASRLRNGSVHRRCRKCNVQFVTAHRRRQPARKVAS